MLTPGKLYPLADHVPMRDNATLRAQTVGIFRAPRKGEWYISGSIPSAYRAPNDLTQSFDLARIVRVKLVTTTLVVEVL